MGARAPLRDGCTSIHFGENQLSPGSIGISPLATGHPPVLQHRWVRASTRSYPRFTLPMASSPGFGSHLRNTLVGLAPKDQAARPVQTTRFRCGSTPFSEGLTCLCSCCADALAGSFYKRHAVTRRRAPKSPSCTGFDCW